MKLNQALIESKVKKNKKFLKPTEKEDKVIKSSGINTKEKEDYTDKQTTPFKKTRKA
jgi:hypothetical protein